MLIYQPPKIADRIPIVDLEASFSGNVESAREVAWEIHKASRETGFFYVRNHGIDQALITDQFSWTRRFFDLSIEEKCHIHMRNSPTTMGYEPMGGQQSDSQDITALKGPPDLKESFYCGTELPDDHPWAAKHIRSFGHNQWPDLPGFREQALQYWTASKRLADHLMCLIALSLEQPANWFARHFDMPGAPLRLIKYPPQPRHTDFNQLGCGAHTDWGAITLLAQDEVGGLEVRNAAGEWIAAKPVPGTLVINLGDLLARWTNGIYNSNMHRVKNNNASKDRYSIVFFYTARPDAVVEPIPTCVTAEHPRRFETCTAYEHGREMFARSFGYTPPMAMS
jgi:isopenicillin N synthase-like dioxygenase